MIKGTGIDIIEIRRLEKMYSNEHFMYRFFTDEERKYLSSKKVESTAGYFCAKEAVAKALGTGFSGFNWTDIEILKDSSKPIVVLHNNAQKIAEKRGITVIHISISHCNDYSTAIAIAEGL